MKFPADVRKDLQRRFKSRHRHWLSAGGNPNHAGGGAWPLEVSLGRLTESQALKQVEDVRAWVAAWRSWQGAGTLSWADRHWRKLGTQQIPDKLALANPREVAEWAGEAERWALAQRRYGEFTKRWPALAGELPRHFDTLADYGDVDCQRLLDTLAWIEMHPESKLYPRQLPVDGLDSKWLEKRKGLLANLVDAMRGETATSGDPYARLGLQTPPQLVRLRLLDGGLRARLGGLGDLAAPWEQLAELALPVNNIFIVENLQSGLAFGDLPGSVVIMQLGYRVDVLSRLPWVTSSRCIYWGDLDTHGFAILSRARGHLPHLQSVLMDEQTLHRHRDLWVEEREQHGAENLPLLSDAEQAVYQAIKRNSWGQNVRLEQERIAWDIAWDALRQKATSR